MGYTQSKTNVPIKQKTKNSNDITLKTGFHDKSRCLKVGRVPAGLVPGAWVGAADLLGRVSHTRTVLDKK